jgi:hypothetical protein
VPQPSEGVPPGLPIPELVAALGMELASALGVALGWLDGSGIALEVLGAADALGSAALGTATLGGMATLETAALGSVAELALGAPILDGAALGSATLEAAPVGTADAVALALATPLPFGSLELQAILPSRHALITSSALPLGRKAHRREGSNHITGKGIRLRRQKLVEDALGERRVAEVVRGGTVVLGDPGCVEQGIEHLVDARNRSIAALAVL